MNGQEELSVERIGEDGFLVKYREGRFNPDTVEKLDDLEDVRDLVNGLVNEGWSIDTDPAWHSSRVEYTRDSYSINVYETDVNGSDRVVLLDKDAAGKPDTLKFFYVEEG